MTLLIIRMGKENQNHVIYFKQQKYLNIDYYSTEHEIDKCDSKQIKYHIKLKAKSHLKP